MRFSVPFGENIVLQPELKTTHNVSEIKVNFLEESSFVTDKAASISVPQRRAEDHAHPTDACLCDSNVAENRAADSKSNHSDRMRRMLVSLPDPEKTFNVASFSPPI